MTTSFITPDVSRHSPRQPLPLLVPRKNAPRSLLATLVAALAIAALPFASPARAQQSSTNPQPVNSQPATGQGTSAAASSAAAYDDDDDDQPAPSRWPMRIAVPLGVVTIYQPQLAGFADDRLTGRAAISLLPHIDATEQVDNDNNDDASQPTPIFGAIWLESRVMTDRAQRTVRIIDARVTRVHLPSTENNLSHISEADLGQGLTQALTQDPITLSLDQLIAMLDEVNKDSQAVRDIVNTPPKIVFVNQPSMLVPFDGQPRFVRSNDDDNLMFAVNTPFFVALDKRIERYYLKGAGNWYIARQATGPYLNIQVVPDDVTKAALALGYVDPEQDMADAQDNSGLPTPAVLTSTEPTELIWTLGPEELTPIANTNLLYVTNTDSDIILDIDSQYIYVLLSGRWYRSSSRSGPWLYMPPDLLPADFARVPVDSEKGSILAHVAGTQMARDAVADSYVPQTASIDRANYQQPVVEYDGEPRFETVPNMRVTYAVNTANAVMHINGRYYVCYNAVWYESAFANGPWDLCISVPREVYLLPPTVPIYPVRYVRIYEVTPTVIYTGYLPGYVGCYNYNGVVVYGTGHHYRPWYGSRYYARPYTWGFAARYDPYHSYWGFNVGVNFKIGNVRLWFGASNNYVVTRSVWFGYGGYRPAYYPPRHPPVVWRNNPAAYRRAIENQNAAYRQGYRDARSDARADARTNARQDERQRQLARATPRRSDLNLYERRPDVIRTRTPGRAVIDRDDRIRRAQRIDTAQTPNRRDANTPRADRAPATQRPTTDRANRPYTNPAGTRDRNDIYADDQGNVYRKTIDGWERRENNRWVQSSPRNTTNPNPANTNTRDANRNTRTRNNDARNNDARSNDTRSDTPRTSNPRGVRTESTNPNTNTPNSRDRVNTNRNQATQPRSSADAPRSGRESDNAAQQRSTPRNQQPANTRGRTQSNRNTSQPTPRSTPNPAATRQPESNLNADFRARIRGQQRQLIYEGPASSTPQTTPRATQPAPAQRPQRDARPAQSAPQQPAPKSAPSNNRSAAPPKHSPAAATPAAARYRTPAPAAQQPAANARNNSPATRSDNARQQQKK